MVRRRFVFIAALALILLLTGGFLLHDWFRIKSHAVSLYQQQVKTLSAEIRALKKADLTEENNTLRKLLDQCRSGKAQPPSETVVPASVQTSCTCMKPVTESTFCPSNVSDFKAYDAWLEAITQRGVVPKMGAKFGEHAEINPQWFCNKIAANISPWTKPSSHLKQEDLAIGVYTGERLFASRAMALQSTAGLWWSNMHLFAATSDAFVQVHGMGEKYHLTPDTGKGSGMHVTVQLSNLYILVELYHRYPNAKWFNLVGCDTYVHADYALAALDAFNPDEVWFKGINNPYPYTKDSFNDLDFSMFPDRLNPESSYDFVWNSGGTGFWFSRPALKLFVDNFQKLNKHTRVESRTRAWVNGEKDRSICYCPDVIIGLWMSLLGVTMTSLDHMEGSAHPIDSRQVSHGIDNSKLWLYHYVSARKFLSLDEMLMNDKLDRMVNAGDAQQVVDFFRQFMTKHYDILRRYQGLLKRVATDCKHATNWGAGGDDVPAEQEQAIRNERDLPAVMTDVTDHWEEF